MVINAWRWVFISLLCCLSCACTTLTFSERLAAADTIASGAGFKRQAMSAGQFTVVSYQKIQSSHKVLTVYIEGDGRSYITRTRVSSNPTPSNPMALRLAAADTQSHNIVYLARPCQFVATDTDPECHAKYWTLYSYSPEVVASLNAAVDQLKVQHGFTEINLVGFSGGGALVVLMASQRQDVISIRTVAGNLDIEAFTRFHKVTLMTGSLNPVDFSAAVAAIPQRHFIGAEDDVVPKNIAESYLSYFDQKECINLQVVEGATHLTGWVERWPTFMAQPISAVIPASRE